MKRNKTQMLLRWPRRLMRITGTILLGAYLASVVDPVMANVRNGKRAAELFEAPVQTATEQLAARLIALEELLGRMQRRLQGGFEFEWQRVLAARGRENPPAAASRADLKAQETELAQLTASVTGLLAQSREEMDRLHAASARGGQTPEIAARQAADRMSFEEGTARLALDLSAIRTADSEATFAAAVISAHAWLQRHSSKPAQPSFDPEKLAFGSRNETVRAPAIDHQSLRDVFNTATTGPVHLTDFAATAASTFATPTPADLAPTEDVQITPAIRAKAQELGGSTLALYRYVHDTVRFVPSYGSIQGSDYTLQSQRGNAFDQASLLIALLRASNIPARYVYGTIEVPVEKVMNWVGGVTAPRAALSLLSQGGIPNVGLTEGGEIKTVRLEHVWVETWANQFPGSGVRGGGGDSWTALDPSFKQYEFTEGMQLQSAVPFDAQAFTDHVSANANVNEQQGWVQGVDSTYVAAQMASYTQRVKAHIAAQNENATFGDVLGRVSISPSSLRGLPAGLPYQRLAQAEPTSALADSLRWRFRYALGEQSFWGEEGYEEVIIDRGLPSLAGRALALSFVPATPADQQTLANYLPQNLTSSEQIPRSLPANVVRLKAQFSLDGQTVADGLVAGFGAELSTRKGFYVPGRGWEETDNPLNAGDYQSIGINLQGIAQAHMERQKAHVEAVRAKLDAQQTGGLTPHDLTGGMLQSTLLHYFVQNDTAAESGARLRGIVNYTMPSYGTLSTDSAVDSLFGVPRIVRPGSALIDMDRMASLTVHKSADPGLRADYATFSGGMLSHLEDKVLEQTFSSQQNPVEAISAVKLLAIAGQSGQRIYTLTQDNAGSALATLDLPASVERNIADAVAAGKVVRVHQAPLDFAQQAGVVGYTVLDPDTGAGGYLISAGGANGGKVALNEHQMLGAILILVGLLLFIIAVVFASIFSLILIPLAIWLIGCGLSALSGDDRFFDVANYIVSAILAWLIVILPLGLIAKIALVVLELLIILLNIDDVCAGTGFAPRAQRRDKWGKMKADLAAAASFLRGTESGTKLQLPSHGGSAAAGARMRESTSTAMLMSTSDACGSGPVWLQRWLARDLAADLART